MQNVLPLVLLAGAGWLLIMRPMRRQKAAQSAIAAALAPGAEIITAGGLRGTVVELDDDDVVLEIAEGVHVRFLRGAIRTVLPPQADAVEETEDEGGTNHAGEAVGALEPDPAEPHDPPTD